MTRFIFAVILWSIPAFSLYGQGGNLLDECSSAFFINNPDDYCSNIGQFTTNGATPSAQVRPSCWPPTVSVTSDVWFSFRSTARGLSLRLIGAGNTFPNGGLAQPALALYTGSCNAPFEVKCITSSSPPFSIDLLVTDLIIGQIYFIRVDSRMAQAGDFQICLDMFNPVPEPSSDCGTSVILCDKSPFVVESLSGGGVNNDEANGSCLSNTDLNGNPIPSESGSTWYTWTCEESGTLEFTIEPNNPNNSEEDIDFAVYRLPSGLSNCDDKELLRCMASGETVGASADQNAPCFGATGLSINSTDFTETPGCTAGDDNFVAAIDMVEGESYALLINNFTRSGFGFTIDFGGTGTFLGPQPELEIEAIQAFECDKSIMYIDSSSSFTDAIVRWEWSFGEGADPQFVSGQGPHTVVYDSFGDKTVSLTVESSKGCLVTKVEELFIAPCCSDTTTLNLELTGVDVLCNGDENGELTAIPSRGSPGYQFSVNGEDFTTNSVFQSLAAGNYQVILEDRKGCRDTNTIVITEPGPLVVNAGADQTVDLGFPVDINAVVTPANTVDSIRWQRKDNLPCEDIISCINCLNTSIIAPGSSDYIITVVDETGCIAEDEVRINVSLDRPLFAPNVISTSRGGNNALFIVSTNQAGVLIQEFLVIDRWGNTMYALENIPASNNDEFGWNGKYGNQFVNPGVYVWQAKIQFIDKQVITYHGNVTVIK